VGTPSVFLRLATCNLTCTWCDTKYTWDWQNFDYNQEVVVLDTLDVEQRITGYGCRHLVITGGEPLLQQQELATLVASLKIQRFFCEVETNGTVAPSPAMVRDIDQWNLSPKLANSGNSPERREMPSVLDRFAGLPNAYFKFVVSDPADLTEVRDLQHKYGIPTERIVLMPEGTAPATIEDRSHWVSDACVQEGYRFSTRLHILLWGDERGK
jgi:organic radical activating enzyme